jgi:hypothetical protein
MSVVTYGMARVRGRRLERPVPAYRVVIVLEADGVGRVDEAVELAASRGGRVLVLGVGFPQTDAQDAAIRLGIERAWDIGVHLEAVLVASRREVSSYLLPGDALVRGHR